MRSSVVTSFLQELFMLKAERQTHATYTTKTTSNKNKSTTTTTTLTSTNRKGRSEQSIKMTLRLISMLSLALLIVLPAQLDAFITRNAGCYHNGTWYADKSLVPTMEKCLNCQCNKKTLVCRLKVCPEMPMPPPRGCVVVQKKNTCCPYLSCARLDAFYKIPTKRRIIAYLDHYERESIDRVVNDNMLQRRSDDTDVDLFVCVKNGTVYKSGSAMSSSNLCSYCYCIGGTEKCVKPKCMLPVEGCKPIFVDSTCCPVRYDCSTKTSGKSSQEVRYRKTSNKHFQRMSQRPQRNRGCTVGAQFYAEGQKMKSDVDRPCDICFCIRGTRRCAPKKCAPALKNCIPVVPKGQCCPSSYDCGSQRDYRRAQSSRQFNLYNLLFGKEEQHNGGGTLVPSNAMAEHYPQDRHPTVSPMGNALQASSEKSILDTLREGLEFIDGNNNQMLADNVDLLALQTTPKSSNANIETISSTDEQGSSTTTLSFLDLLLGPSTENATSAESEDLSPATSKKPLSWVDLLLGSDEDDGQPQGLRNISTQPQGESSTASPELDRTTNNIKRIADDFEDSLSSGEIGVGELPAEAQQMVVPNLYATNSDVLALTPKPIEDVTSPTLFNAFLEGLSGMLDEPTANTTVAPNTTTAIPISSTTPTTTTSTTTKPPRTRPPPMFRPLPTKKQHTRINSKLANLTVTLPMITTKSEVQAITVKPVPGKSNTTTRRPRTTTTTATKTIPTTRRATTITSRTTKPLSTRRTTSTTTTESTTTIKTITSIAPKSAQTTTAPTTTSRTITTTRSPQATVKLPSRKHYSVPNTSKPLLLVKTNPITLDAESLDNTAELTLPPSLPNLKIIPFLPTDAVSTAPIQHQAELNYNYYQSHASQIAADKIDTVAYDGVFEEPSMYPAMTSAYPAQHDQAAYKYKFNVEGPDTAPAPVVSLGGKYDGSATYVKYDFETQPAANGGFQPPIETEGGFMPKEPLVIDGEVLQEHVTPQNVQHTAGGNYHVTPHIIDITTPAVEDINATAVIEITTPDPFKDVIHTELPPSLHKLIVDKPHNGNNESAGYNSSVSIMKSTTLETNAPTSIDKIEINKLDKLLDELLGMDTSSSSTVVPPFKNLPIHNNQHQLVYSAESHTVTIATSQTAATRITNTTSTKTMPTSTTADSPTPPPTRAKKGNKTKSKLPGNRRNATSVGKPGRTKGQQSVIRRTSPTVAATPLASAKTKGTQPPVATTILITTPMLPITTAIATPTITTMATTGSITTTSTTVHPFLMSPFDKLPFMDTSYEVRPHMSQPQSQQLQPEQQLQTFHHYQHAHLGHSPVPDSSTVTTNAPPDGAGVGAAAESVASVPTPLDVSVSGNVDGNKDALNNLIDPIGILKLAGCNIYGRMYRVGRIIVELSSQCLECRCTEVGVKCGPLDC